MTIHDDFSFAMRELVPAPSGQRFAVAVSGGADSYAMALLLRHWVRKSKGEFVAAITVDHALRPESKDEAQRVKNALKAFGIAHETLTWEGEKPSSNIQAAAREARYNLMSEWCKEHNVDYLCTGHQMGDQAETVLMRMFRGSGINGLCAMSPISNFGHLTILRPLLLKQRTELEEYIRTEGIVEWENDPSNVDQRFQRSRIRDIIQHSQPLVGVSPDQLIERLTHVSFHMQRARDYFTDVVHTFLDEHAVFHPLGYLSINQDAFCAQHTEVGLRILAHVLKLVSGSNVAPRFDSLSPIYSSLVDPDDGSPYTLHGCMVRPHSRGHIDIIREPSAIKDVVKVRNSLSTEWDNGRFICKVDISENSGNNEYQIKLLSSEGLKSIRDSLSTPLASYIPQRALHSLPSLWSNGVPVLVPHFNYRAEGFDEGVRMTAELEGEADEVELQEEFALEEAS